jgi:hypothetical protein
MHGGEAAATHVISEVNEAVEESIEESHLKEAVDASNKHISEIEKLPVAKQKQAVAKNMKSDTKKIVTSISKLKATMNDEIKDSGKLVAEITGGKVGEVIPAFDKLSSKLLQTMDANISSLETLVEKMKGVKGTQKHLKEIEGLLESSIYERSELIKSTETARNNIRDSIKNANQNDILKNQNGSDEISKAIGYIEMLMFGLIAASIGATLISYCSPWLIANSAWAAAANTFLSAAPTLTTHMAFSPLSSIHNFAGVRHAVVVAASLLNDYRIFSLNFLIYALFTAILYPIKAMIGKLVLGMSGISAAYASGKAVIVAAIAAI